MKLKRLFRNALTAVPSWIFIGAAVVMLPVVLLMAREQLQRQQADNLRLMTEKGEALIRSFEAGTRHGMIGMGRSGFRLQRLLAETARQPDIVYLSVTETDGIIVAHSDPLRIGGRFEYPPEAAAEDGVDRLRWRIAQGPDDQKVFEVYRRFEPTMGPGVRGRRHAGMMGMPSRSMPMDDWEETRKMIFVGLDMGPVEAADRAGFRHTMTMAAVLLLVGFSGIVLLLMAQSFQATRASLSRERAFSGSVVEHMPVGLLALDDTLRVTLLNPKGREILGVEGAVKTGTDPRDVLPDALLSVAADLGGGLQVLAREIDCPVADGRHIPLEVSASPLSDEDGSPAGTIILFSDRREVVALRREVARTQRLASIGQLAAGVAHEIRNPLSSIKGLATVFRERYRNAPEDRDTARLMIQEVDRLNRVVGQLLEFSRPIAVVPRPVRLGDLLEDMRRLIADRAEGHEITVETLADPTLPPRQTDPDLLRQVLFNLCLNAIESMPDGGRLVMSAAEEPGGDGFRIQVSDTGRGIPEKDLARIFDPYFTTRNAGTGLGLAIVHNILEAMEGAIRVDSRVGKGTTVTLSFSGRGGRPRPSPDSRTKPHGEEDMDGGTQTR
ncbi:MAG: ATP-binding protein [Desulfobacterales bacterium]